MPEAVIVATARTPIGRANKGSLVDCRPDDLSALVIRAVLDKVPELDPATVEDVIWGCGQPAGEAGFNVARVAAILAGVDVAGRHGQPLLLVVAADDPHGRARDQGRRRRRVRRRRCRDREPLRATARPTPAVPNEKFGEARARTKLRTEGGQPKWTPPVGLPDVYIAMGQTAENVVEAEGVTREEMDEFGARSQQRAVAAQENGFFEREITPVTLPDGTVVTKDDGPRAGTTVEKLATLKPVFRPDGSVTAGQRVPAQRRRGRGRRDERHQGEVSSGSRRSRASSPAA